MASSGSDWPTAVDAQVPEPLFTSTHALTSGAPAEQVSTERAPAVAPPVPAMAFD
jgi:hypothetical protein